jgi:hypothetical protein
MVAKGAARAQAHHGQCHTVCALQMVGQGRATLDWVMGGPAELFRGRVHQGLHGRRGWLPHKA